MTVPDVRPNRELQEFVKAKLIESDRRNDQGAKSLAALEASSIAELKYKEDYLYLVSSGTVQVFQEAAALLKLAYPDTLLTGPHNVYRRSTFYHFEGPSTTYLHLTWDQWGRRNHSNGRIYRQIICSVIRNGEEPEGLKFGHYSEDKDYILKPSQEDIHVALNNSIQNSTSGWFSNRTLLDKMKKRDPRKPIHWHLV
jgi:hypothetical protein